MTTRLSIALAAAALVALPALAAPPPPPGGHLPVFEGGANQGAYPPLSASAGEPGPPALGSLLEASSSPNPFRGTTTIRFTLASGDEARLRIFDLAGRQVRDLTHRAAAAGPQEVSWDGRDGESRALPSGVYFFQLDSGGRSVTRKLALLR
jgi:hypothetical protein